MPRFRVQLRGDNFLLDLDGEHAKFGLRATRIIKAETEQEAVKIAIIRLHQQINKSNQLVKDTLDAPNVYLERTETLKFYQRCGGRKYQEIKFIKEETDAD